jgi:hypothetical protein
MRRARMKTSQIIAFTHVAIEVEENDVVQRRVSICDEEMPWTRRRRLGRIKHAIAEAAF